jgi:hypothetical protein
MKKATFQGPWTHDEKTKFLQAISIKNLVWSEIAEIVVTRSAAQCRSHYQKLTISKKINIRREKHKVNNRRSNEVISRQIQCNSTDDSSSEPVSGLLLPPTDQLPIEKRDEFSKALEFFDDGFESPDDFSYF